MKTQSIELNMQAVGPQSQTSNRKEKGTMKTALSIATLSLLRLKYTILATILLGLAITPALRAQTTLYVSTGLSANGQLIRNEGQFDAHWTVQQMSGQYTPAQVVQDCDPDSGNFCGGGPWQPDGPNSAWIARNAFTANNGAGPYSFKTTFYLNGVAGASFTGMWAIDDVGSLRLNNCLIETGGWYALHTFPPVPSSCFVTGVNTITITMNSTDNYLEAVRLEATVHNDPSPTQCVLPPNTTMVAWYPFDELAVGTSANLATGNTGTQPYGLGITNGKVGKAASFSGNQWVESPSSLATNFGPGQTAAACSTGSSDREGDYSSCRGNFSIDTWVYVTSLSDVMTIVDKRSGSHPAIYGYSFFLHNDQMALQLADGVGTQGYTNYFSPPLPNLTNGWHLISVTVDRLTATGITWYYDGTTIGTSNPTDRPGFLVNSSPLRIGTRTGAEAPLSGWFVGKLDELEIFNRVLTADEVQGIFNADWSGKCKPPPPPPCTPACTS